MADQAHVQTDKILEEIEKKVAKEYKKAHKEVTAKMDDYLARFAIKDKKWQEWVANGTKTQAEYKQWKKGQVLMGQRWGELKDSLAQDYVNAAKISQSIANGYKPEVYALNHNYATFEIEKKSQVDTSYTLYSRESVERMYRDNPKLYHKPGRTISQEIREGKQAAWDKRRIQSVITQGILQGESIPQLTQRLEKVTGGDHKAAIRNIRTMMTGVQNAGRIDAQNRAKNMGIPVRKQWMATLDSRTRHWHRDLDGETAETDDPFVHSIPGNPTAEIMFPGDPSAAPVDLYNCRCTLLSAIRGHEIDLSDTSLRHDKNLGKMSYDEWKDAKAPVTSNPITMPEKKAATIRQRYINEYRGYGSGTRSAAEGRAEAPVSAHVVAEGKDITGTWKRREGQFAFEIEDVMSAQGFDGLPRVVSRAEFDEAVKAANGGKGFIAQRTYSAESKEILDAYRDQLYKGKWYVDCSTGGSQYGQGMYCAADYTGKLTDGIKAEMDHYRDLGRGRALESAYDKATYEALQSGKMTPTREQVEKAFKGGSYTETLTLDPSARVISWRDLQDLRNGNLDVISYRQKIIDEEIKKMGLTSDEATFLKFNLGGNVSWDEVDGAARRLGNEGRNAMMEKVESIGQKATSAANAEQARRSEMAHIYQEKYSDPGSMAAGLGYDAINAEGHGESGSYTVVLNRTKLIIRGES